MARLKIEFIKAGMLTSIQDSGRSGNQDKGIPVSGALDKKSYHRANVLVGNAINSPCLEITFLGPEIYFYEQAKIAVCGATFPLTLNGKEEVCNKLINVPANSTLAIGKATEGCRAYIAVAGTWQVTKWLGSAARAVYYADELTPDSTVKEGSKIEIESRNIDLPASSKLKTYPETGIKHEFTVYPGPEFEQFSRAAIASFFGSDHQIGPQSNRVAYQLKSALAQAAVENEILSSGVIPGTIQVTAVGQVIILLSDAQTTGGYPRIAQMKSDDLDSLAQLKGGDDIRFNVELT